MKRWESRCKRKVYCQLNLKQKSRKRELNSIRSKEIAVRMPLLIAGMQIVRNTKESKFDKRYIRRYPMEVKRKQTFRDLVDPQPIVAKVKQNEVESKPKVSVDIPSIDLTKYDKDIANLERKIQDLYKANALRQAQVAIEAELAILEAKRLAELDDEEAILLLL